MTWGYPGTYQGMNLGVPGYLPEYDQQNQLWYPGTDACYHAIGEQLVVRVTLFWPTNFLTDELLEICVG